MTAVMISDHTADFMFFGEFSLWSLLSLLTVIVIGVVVSDST